MTDFSLIDGVATIHDPELYQTWMDLDGVTAPAVVGVLVEGELASVMTRQPTPDPMVPGSTYDWYSLAVFRLGNGRLSEQWGAFKKMAPGQGPM